MTPLTAEQYRDADWLKAYPFRRQMPNGELCGVALQIYTAGLFVGLDEYGYKRRYCYESISEAVDALDAWDGNGDPPGPWIKEKPSGRLGPGALK